MDQEICAQCEEQVKKTCHGRAHEALVKVDEVRVFRGRGSRGYEEQDYQCRTCRAKFTGSSNKNDLAWTLWRG